MTDARAEWREDGELLAIDAAAIGVEWTLLPLFAAVVPVDSPVWLLLVLACQALLIWSAVLVRRLGGDEGSRDPSLDLYLRMSRLVVAMVCLVYPLMVMALFQGMTWTEQLWAPVRGAGGMVLFGLLVVYPVLMLRHVMFPLPNRWGAAESEAEVRRANRVAAVATDVALVVWTGALLHLPRNAFGSDAGGLFAAVLVFGGIVALPRITIAVSRGRRLALLLAFLAVAARLLHALWGR